MPNDTPTPRRLQTERQARILAASIDEAGDDLERNGPISPVELRARLEALEAEWSEDAADRPAGGKADPRKR
jgi:hypothetical protein